MPSSASIIFYTSDAITGPKSIKYGACKVYSFLRSTLSSFKNDFPLFNNEESLKQSGIYLLIGKSVYVGKADTRSNKMGILNRVYEHKRNDDESLWENVLLIVSAKIDQLDSADLSFLENFINEKVAESGVRTTDDLEAASKENGNTPPLSYISDEKKVELKNFYSNVKIAFHYLGYDYLLTKKTETGKKIEIPENRQDGADKKRQRGAISDNIFQLCINKGNICAEGHFTGNYLNDELDFILHKGSIIASAVTEKADDRAVKIRQDYASKIADDFKIKEDIELSLNKAGMLVAGHALNSKTEWRQKSSGKSINELINKK